MTFSSGPPSSGGGKLPRPARRVVASFIQGKTTLAIDQWLVAVDEKLLVVTATRRPPATQSLPMSWWR